MESLFNRLKKDASVIFKCQIEIDIPRVIAEALK